MIVLVGFMGAGKTTVGRELAARLRLPFVDVDALVESRAGGTEGGMTIGGTLRARAAMKPLSTLKRRLRSVDLSTGDPVEAFQERTDVCAVPAAGVVCEHVVALVLADAFLEMFGGDTLDDLQASVNRYRRRTASRAPRERPAGRAVEEDGP